MHLQRCWLINLMALVAFAACGDDDASNSDAGQDEDAHVMESEPDSGGGEVDSGPADAGDHDATVEEEIDDAGTDAGEGDAGTDAGTDAGAQDAGIDAGEPALSLGGLTVDTTPAQQTLDLFGVPGHRFWIEVSEKQLARLNSGAGGGPWYGDDIYTPVVSGSFADHILVQDALSGSVADYGKMEIKLVGESTRRQWDLTQIPNIHIDTDEFQKGARIGTFEHFRLNNSLVGSIFRETVAHRVIEALGYPALRASWAFLGSNVWGDGVWVPMTLVEMYKLRFCDDNADILGGTCMNMWEFAGDIGNGGGNPGPFPNFPIDDFGGADAEASVYLPPNACQIKECDDTRLEETIEALAQTPFGPGFKDAMDPYIEWDYFHRFQCIDWMLWIGDDPIHNSNNNLIIEREDGKLIWAPYSVDISAGQDWYQDTPLVGSSTLARGCQSDPECWADTIAACEALITKFDALDPEHIVDEAVDTLSALDMMRSGDPQRGKQLRQWYLERQLELPAELERYRYLPDVNGQCPQDLELCNDGGCGTSEQCAERLCSPGTQWCESSQECIDPRWGYCPTCTEEEPYYCSWVDACVASRDECAPSCEFGYEFCPYWGYCVPYGECPYVDGVDGGVFAGTGAMGGMIAPPPFPAMGK